MVIHLVTSILSSLSISFKKTDTYWFSLVGTFFPTNFGEIGSSLCPLSIKQANVIDLGLPEYITASIDALKVLPVKITSSIRIISLS